MRYRRTVQYLYLVAVPMRLLSIIYLMHIRLSTKVYPFFSSHYAWTSVWRIYWICSIITSWIFPEMSRLLIMHFKILGRRINPIRFFLITRVVFNLKYYLIQMISLRLLLKQSLISRYNILFNLLILLKCERKFLIYLIHFFFKLFFLVWVLILVILHILIFKILFIIQTRCYSIYLFSC